MEIIDFVYELFDIDFILYTLTVLCTLPLERLGVLSQTYDISGCKSLEDPRTCEEYIGYKSLSILPNSIEYSLRNTSFNVFFTAFVLALLRRIIEDIFSILKIKEYIQSFKKEQTPLYYLKVVLSNILYFTMVVIIKHPFDLMSLYILYDIRDIGLINHLTTGVYDPIDLLSILYSGFGISIFHELMRLIVQSILIFIYGEIFPFEGSDVLSTVSFETTSMITGFIVYPINVLRKWKMVNHLNLNSYSLMLAQIFTPKIVFALEINLLKIIISVLLLLTFGYFFTLNIKKVRAYVGLLLGVSPEEVKYMFNREMKDETEDNYSLQDKQTEDNYDVFISSANYPYLRRRKQSSGDGTFASQKDQSYYYNQKVGQYTKGRNNKGRQYTKGRRDEKERIRRKKKARKSYFSLMEEGYDPTDAYLLEVGYKACEEISKFNLFDIKYSLHYLTSFN